MSDRHLDNMPKHYDSFSDTWGSSTAWKSGTCRWLQSFSLQDGVSDTPNVHRVTATTIPAPSRYVDKPLPPIPREPTTVVSPVVAFKDDGPSIPHTPTPAAKSSPTGFSLKRVFSTVLRKPSKRQTDENLSRSVPQIPAPFLEPTSSLSPIRDPVPTVTPRRPTYVDKGTQTSPRLLPMRPSEPQAQVNLRKSSKSARRPTINRHESSMSPMAGEMQGSGNKGFWVKMTPHDYFSLPFRPEKQPSESTTSTSSTDSNSNPDLAVPPHVNLDLKSIKSNASIGSYESRYSAPETSIAGRERPNVARSSNSESGLETERKSSGSLATVKASTRPHHSGRSVTGVGPARPMPMPFMRLPSFSGSRGRQSRSSSDSVSRSSESPLRHSMQIPEDSPADFSGPPSPGMYRNPVVTPDPQPEYLSYIPEHLKGSPLCPRSPKHESGGTGFCPMHGQNPSSLGLSPSVQSLEMAGLEKLVRPPARTRGSTDGSFDETLKRIKFSIPRHSPDSPDCPANAGSKGACPYHGRPGQMASRSSDESMPLCRLQRF